MNSQKNVFALLMLMFGAAMCAPAVGAPTSPSPQLRHADFSCDKSTIRTAVELKQADWTYIMPEPKSPQAAWGNHDGRTTWWVGYWVNGTTAATSSAQPTKISDGGWVGDGYGHRAWRRGGTPAPPTKVEWLCSGYGGIPPR